MYATNNLIETSRNICTQSTQAHYAHTCSKELSASSWVCSVGVHNAFLIKMHAQTDTHTPAAGSCLPAAGCAVWACIMHAQTHTHNARTDTHTNYAHTCSRELSASSWVCSVCVHNAFLIKMHAQTHTHTHTRTQRPHLQQGVVCQQLGVQCGRSLLFS